MYSFGRIVNAALHDEVVVGPVTPFELEDFGCGGVDVTQTDVAAPQDAAAQDRNWRGDPPYSTMA